MMGRYPWPVHMPEMENNAAEGRISAFLTVEEGGILNGQMKRLEDLYGSGIRLMTLMWNYENCIGYPASKDASVMWQGLKPFGIEVARRMNELGMIIDLSMRRMARSAMCWNMRQRAWW